MRYHSTRDDRESVTLSEAIERGLAPDGGLYVPAEFPRLGPDHAPGAFDGLSTLPEIGELLLAPFFAGDPLAESLGEICRAAFDFPVPLKPLPRRTAVLELFHGPTAAFKDIGARFLAECLSRIAMGGGGGSTTTGEQPLTVLTATSGDTGGAVAAAFHGRPGVEVVILYPKGLISPRQERQLTVWGGNVRAFAVRGDFDACQRLVKDAFADPSLRATRRLTSANSINIGRLLPQMVYYAVAGLEYQREHGVAPGVVIPTGNVGSAVGAFWAKRVGLPIRQVALATNANRTITEFLAGGEWAPRPTVATLASAMDVGNPSNMERLFHLFGGADAARRELRAILVDDEVIREQIRAGPERWGEVWDPHTATAVAAREELGTDDWIVVATAHPAKFETIVEPLIGRSVPIPESLARLLDRPSRTEELEPDLDELRRRL